MIKLANRRRRLLQRRVRPNQRLYPQLLRANDWEKLSTCFALISTTIRYLNRLNRIGLAGVPEVDLVVPATRDHQLLVLNIHVLYALDWLRVKIETRWNQFEIMCRIKLDSTCVGLSGVKLSHEGLGRRGIEWQAVETSVEQIWNSLFWEGVPSIKQILNGTTLSCRPIVWACGCPSCHARTSPRP